MIDRGWEPPRCAHGHILLGCPERDCPEQNTYLAEQNRAADAYFQRLEDTAAIVVAEALGRR
jgi:hypothetical protein